VNKTRRAIDSKRAQLQVAGQELRALVTAAAERATAAVLGRFGVPSKSEIRDLIQQVSALTAKVERMNATKV
jgi:hypothetical protein